jgi:hypothetical protein
MEQKSVVMFYWPSVILLIAGVHFVFQKRTLKSASVITGLFLVSLVDYVFSNSVVYQRLLLIMLPLSIIMAIGLLKIWQSRTVGAVISLVLLYGVYTNIYDMSMRADFWLDNRPLVYEFWYKNLKVYSENNVVNRIRVSTLIGNSRNYCQFYFGSECDSDKFVFDSFDLSVGVKEKGVYLGFAGEFVGPKFKNDIDPLWDSVASSNGIRIVSKKNIRDTVAYRYGNDIGLGEVK